MRIGVDLRHVPELGDSRAGVEHAGIELTEELECQAPRYGAEIVRLYSPKRAWAFRHAVIEAKVDCLLVVSGSVPPFMPVPCFPWAHDLAIFTHPEWFPQSWLKRFVTTRLFLRGVRKSSHVFSVSEDTKKDLVKIAGIDPKKITVTYQGIHPIEKGDTKPYALILGSVNPRKNTEFIKELWPDVQKCIPKAELIIAGRPLMQFSDAQRDDFVRHATMLLHPSLHEGFGRTPLEAMSAGVPVIASNRGAIPEVVGDAGILLDPTDSKVWIEAIVRGFRGELDGSRGIERSKRFSWEKTASLMLAKLGKTW
jgi:glycosyltransferase involved in cell wall biosynthesis